MYLSKYYPDPSELYRKLTQRKGEKIELPDKYYRKLKKDMPHEKMQEMGYARPQTRLNTELEAEELGSTLLFKVPRHCRNYHELAEQQQSFNSSQFNLTSSAINVNESYQDSRAHGVQKGKASFM